MADRSVDVTISATDQFSAVADQVVGKIGGIGAAAEGAAGTVGSAGESITSAFEQANQASESLAQGFQHPIDAATSLTEQLTGGLSTALQNLGPEGEIAAGIFTGIAGAAVIAGSAIVEFADHAAESGEAIERLSLSTGGNVEAMSNLKIAVEAAGGDVQQVSNAMFMMTSRFEQGGAAATKIADGFELLGLNAKQVLALPIDQQILTIADAFQKTTDATTRTTAAADLWSGRMGREMLPLVLKPLGELNDESAKLGNTWSGESVAAAAEFSEQTKILESTLGTLEDRIGIGVIGALNGLLAVIKSAPGGFQAAQQAASGLGATIGKELTAGVVAADAVTGGAITDLLRWGGAFDETGKKAKTFGQDISLALPADAKTAITDYVGELGQARDAVGTLSRAELDNIQAALQLGVSAKTLADQYGLIPGELEAIKKLLADQAASVQTVTIATQTQIETLHDAGESEAEIAKALDLHEATVRAVIKAESDYEKAERDVQTALKESQRLELDLERFREETLGTSAKLNAKYYDEQDALAQRSAKTTADAFIKGQEEIRKADEDLALAQDSTRTSTYQKNVDTLTKWESDQLASFHGTAAEYAIFADTIHQTFEDKIASLGPEWVSDLGDLSKAFGSFSSSTITGLSSIGKEAQSAIGDFQQMGKGISEISDSSSWVGAISGAISFVGALSGAIGVISSIISGIAGIFNNSGRDAVVSFAQSYGGFDVLHHELDQLPGGEDLWVQLTQQVGSGDKSAAEAIIAKIQTLFASTSPNGPANQTPDDQLGGLQPGDTMGSGKGLTSYATGGFVPGPTVAVVGDAPGGEFIASVPQITGVIAAGAALATGAGNAAIVNAVQQNNSLLQQIVTLLQQAQHHTQTILPRAIRDAMLLAT